jgi:hypothetical protein
LFFEKSRVLRSVHRRFISGESRVSRGTSFQKQTGGRTEEIPRALANAVLVARKRIHTSAKKFGSFTLVQVELLAYFGNVAGVNVSRVHLPLMRPKQLAVTVTVFAVQEWDVQTSLGQLIWTFRLLAKQSRKYKLIRL